MILPIPKDPLVIISIYIYLFIYLFIYLYIYIYLFIYLFIYIWPSNIVANQLFFFLSSLTLISFISFVPDLDEVSCEGWRWYNIHRACISSLVKSSSSGIAVLQTLESMQQRTTWRASREDLNIQGISLVIGTITVSAPCSHGIHGNLFSFFFLLFFLKR